MKHVNFVPRNVQITFKKILVTYFVIYFKYIFAFFGKKIGALSKI